LSCVLASLIRGVLIPQTENANRVKNEILSRLVETQAKYLTPKAWQRIRVGALLLAASGAAFATLGVIGPDKVSTTPVSTSLSPLAPVLATIDDEDRGVFREERILRGDTLGTLLARLGVLDAEAFKFLRTDDVGKSISNNLRPGRNIRAETDTDGTLLSLSYALAPGEVITIERDGDKFSAERRDQVLERRVHMKAAEIRSSLFGAADAVGLPDSVTVQIAEIFSGDIDFIKDIRRGDRFRVVYEMLYSQGEFVKAGRVLAVEFVNNNKTFAAVWFENADAKGDDAKGGYYTPEGKNLRKAFLRSPLEFSRITSGFGPRSHPIFSQWKMHRGVDYAAPTGTKIRSVGDGVVEFIGKQNGYGNVVVVRHHGQHSTLYAHMSGFGNGIKKGSRVSQGHRAASAL
jgi:murein DD-endopeptidase MepM/ murein hydrolase activator NlpD